MTAGSRATPIFLPVILCASFHKRYHLPFAPTRTAAIMTTAGTGSRPPRPGVHLMGPLASAGLAGILVAAVGVLVSGSPAVAGAVLGTGLVCAVFAFGGLVLGVVATVAPGASMLVALLTYTLEVVLLALVLVGLNGSGVLDGPVDRRWLAGAVIVCTLVWITAQLVSHVRTRQPLYDLPSQPPREGGSAGEEASVR